MTYQHTVGYLLFYSSLSREHARTGIRRQPLLIKKSCRDFSPLTKRLQCFTSLEALYL